MPMISARAAIQKLQSGDIVAIPTETVYGLAGSIASRPAIEKIFRTKERPYFDPLIVHVIDLNSADHLVSAKPKIMQELAKEFWPGPLTLILDKTSHVDDLITSGLPRVALRSPQHPIAQEILRSTGPLAAPSANKFTKTSPTNAQHVLDEFGDVVDVVDGGPCQVGLESTVVGLDSGYLEILRPGRILAEDLLPFAQKHHLEIRSASAKASPGQHAQHYQPAVPLVMVQRAMSENSLREVVAQQIQKEFTLKYLQLPADPVLAARLFYAELRKLAEDSTAVIVADPSRWSWSGDTADLMDRLKRAARLVIH